MQHFLYRLNPPRSSFATDMTDTEAGLMQTHGAFWADLTAKRSALLFGPVFDANGPWGLAIIEAEDDKAAEAIAQSDPAIMANAGFSFELYPMQIGAVRITAA